MLLQRPIAWSSLSVWVRLSREGRRRLGRLFWTTRCLGLPAGSGKRGAALHVEEQFRTGVVGGTPSFPQRAFGRCPVQLRPIFCSDSFRVPGVPRVVPQASLVPFAPVPVKLPV